MIDPQKLDTLLTQSKKLGSEASSDHPKVLSETKLGAGKVQKQVGDVEVAVHQDAPKTLEEFKNRFSAQRPDYGVHALEKIEEDGVITQEEREVVHELQKKSAEQLLEGDPARDLIERYARHTDKKFNHEWNSRVEDLSWPKRKLVEWFKVRSLTKKVNPGSVATNALEEGGRRNIYFTFDDVLRDAVGSNSRARFGSPYVSIDGESAVKLLKERVMEGGASVESLMVEAAGFREPVAVAAAFALMLRTAKSPSDFRNISEYLKYKSSDTVPGLLREALLLTLPELRQKSPFLVANLTAFRARLGLEDQAKDADLLSSEKEGGASLRTHADFSRLLSGALLQGGMPPSESEAEELVKQLVIMQGQLGPSMKTNPGMQSFALELLERGWCLDQALSWLCFCRDNSEGKAWKMIFEPSKVPKIRDILVGHLKAGEVADVARITRYHIQSFGAANEGGVIRAMFEAGVSFGEISEMIRETTCSLDLATMKETGAWLIECIAQETVSEQTVEAILEHLFAYEQSQFHTVSRRSRYVSKEAYDAAVKTDQERKRVHGGLLRQALKAAKARGLSRNTLLSLVDKNARDAELKNSLKGEFELVPSLSALLSPGASGRHTP